MTGKRHRKRKSGKRKRSEVFEVGAQVDVEYQVEPPAPAAEDAADTAGAGRLDGGFPALVGMSHAERTALFVPKHTVHIQWNEDEFEARVVRAEQTRLVLR